MHWTIQSLFLSKKNKQFSHFDIHFILEPLGSALKEFSHITCCNHVGMKLFIKFDAASRSRLKAASGFFGWTYAVSLQTLGLAHLQTLKLVEQFTYLSSLGI